MEPATSTRDAPRAVGVLAGALLGSALGKQRRKALAGLDRCDIVLVAADNDSARSVVVERLALGAGTREKEDSRVATLLAQLRGIADGNRGLNDNQAFGFTRTNCVDGARLNGLVSKKFLLGSYFVGVATTT